MGLVNGEQGQVAFVQELKKEVGQQPLWRDIDQIQIAGPHAPFDRHGFGKSQARVECFGAYTQLLEALHLVLHQGDQGGYHDGEAFSAKRRDLKAKRFAAPVGIKTTASPPPQTCSINVSL